MTPPRALASFGAAGPPPELLDDVRALARLPEDARAAFWSALGPSLPEPIPKPVEALLDRFVARTGADGADLARALKACRFLVREASRRDLPLARFREDCEALLGGDAESVALLVAGFERGKAVVRRQLAEAAILQHGRLLVGVDWRVDTIRASKDAAGLGQPVVMLTLTYREGDRTERVTLQALPDALGELDALVKAVLR